MRIIAAVICALPLAAAAADAPVPRMLKGMEKGSWRTEILEHSEAKPGQQMPAMTVCTDNLMKQGKEHEASAKSEQQCKHRLLKDSADEAVMETTCPKNTVVTTMKRESPSSMLADIVAKGEHPMHLKMRYTHLGPCREGQAALSYDKNSEQCKKIQASMAKMDPAKECANAGAQRAQCEQTMRQQIAQAKAMCN